MSLHAMVINHPYFYLCMWLKKLNAWDKKLFPGKPVDVSKARLFAKATIIFQAASIIVLLALPFFSRAERIDGLGRILFAFITIALSIKIFSAVRNYCIIKKSKKIAAARMYSTNT